MGASNRTWSATTRFSPKSSFLLRSPKGKTLNADLGDQAVQIALANAAPLKYNATKIDMAKGLLASGLAKLNGTN